MAQQMELPFEDETQAIKLTPLEIYLLEALKENLKSTAEKKKEDEYPCLL